MNRKDGKCLMEDFYSVEERFDQEFAEICVRQDKEMDEFYERRQRETAETYLSIFHEMCDALNQAGIQRWHDIPDEEIKEYIVTVYHETSTALWRERRYQDCISIAEEMLKFDWYGAVDEDDEEHSAVERDVKLDILESIGMIKDTSFAERKYEQYLNEDACSSDGWYAYLHFLLKHDKDRLESFLPQLERAIEHGYIEWDGFRYYQIQEALEENHIKWDYSFITKRAIEIPF